MQQDRWVKCIVSQSNIRGIALDATALVRQLGEMHELDPLLTQGLGEAAIGAILLASFCKKGERINLNIQGTGHYRQTIVEAHPDGAARGYIIQRAETAAQPPDSLGPWGDGVISVLRTKDLESKQPYIGTVPLLTGHLAKDLTFYWVQSEQIPTAIGLEVVMENEKVLAAGGFMIQALPGANENDLKIVQEHIQHMPSLDKILRQSTDPVQLLSDVLQNNAFTLVEEIPLLFRCGCSMERVERTLALLGAAELKAIIDGVGQAFVKCDFCSTDYIVEQQDLERILKKLS